MTPMELDLHGLELDEAIWEVRQALSICEDTFLDLIHGHHHGTILLTYFRSPRFRAEMAKEGLVIQRMEVLNRGKTRFHLS